MQYINDDILNDNEVLQKLARFCATHDISHIRTYIRTYQDQINTINVRTLNELIKLQPGYVFRRRSNKVVIDKIYDANTSQLDVNDTNRSTASSESNSVIADDAMSLNELIEEDSLKDDPVDEFSAADTSDDAHSQTQESPFRKQSSEYKAIDPELIYKSEPLKHNSLDQLAKSSSLHELLKNDSREEPSNEKVLDTPKKETIEEVPLKESLDVQPSNTIQLANPITFNKDSFSQSLFQRLNKQNESEMQAMQQQHKQLMDELKNSIEIKKQTLTEQQTKFNNLLQTISDVYSNKSFEGIVNAIKDMCYTFNCREDKDHATLNDKLIALKDRIEEIETQQQTQQEELNSEIEDVKKGVEYITDAFEELSETTEDAMLRIEELEDEITTLKQQQTKKEKEQYDVNVRHLTGINTLFECINAISPEIHNEYVLKLNEKIAKITTSLDRRSTHKMLEKNENIDAASLNVETLSDFQDDEL